MCGLRASGEAQSCLRRFLRGSSFVTVVMMMVVVVAEMVKMGSHIIGLSGTG